jgi:hypothetical protein
MSRGNADGRRRRLVIVAAIAVAGAAHAQPTHRPEPEWSVNVSLGGFARGNRAAVTHWLERNGYGTAEPKQCGFDALLQASCDPPVPYPKVSGSQVVGWTISVRRVVSEQASLELLAASEQSGTAIGRCDDTATPRDPRCTNRFMTLDFGGASLGSLAVWKRRGLRLGAGPGLLLANWAMEPSHLAGVWLDARYGPERVPVFAHAQYRFYQSTSFSPSEHFTRFNPQTLFLGLGLAIGFDDSQP